MRNVTDLKMAPEVVLTPQLEDYLEAIAELQKVDRVARAKDIADRLEITRGTVTSALRSLSEKGLINYQPYSHITLTKQGEELAEAIIHRHRTISRYLHEVLQLDWKVAEENACRAEHVLDRQVIDRLICHMEFMDRCPRMGPVLMESFREYCQNGTESENCRDCVGRCLADLYQKEDA